MEELGVSIGQTARDHLLAETLFAVFCLFFLGSLLLFFPSGCPFFSHRCPFDFSLRSDVFFADYLICAHTA